MVEIVATMNAESISIILAIIKLVILVRTPYGGVSTQWTGTQTSSPLKQEF